ncbi:LytTR family DNA-binding domain-containing protein [Carboxylicivirga caseinilyticus]|uniref:LytR/AlgR family response regulator transcription factor n=1 Tax=Carboxylicivirga caseinilyticus TaxID=3417572 RepID=UPI002AA8AAF4|nr:LytTR family DNA-binding domain-containing protein [uncultured Carboxylicivirga sp.]MCU4164983.1 LytTR family transcriptional regulator DNA-binding domain-containing protein [Marinilabiliaceae bacterium A049]
MARDYIVLECDLKVLKLAIDDIYYINHQNGLTTFVLNQNNKICHKSLIELENLLPSNFIRINRNCIVNHLAITEINKKDRRISLINKEHLIVSHRNIKSITEAIRTMAINA